MAAIVPTLTADAVRQTIAQRREYPKRTQDRRVGRAHGVKHIAPNDNDIRFQFGDLHHRALKRVTNIRLALIDAARRQSLILPEAEVQIGEVDETHA